MKILGFFTAMSAILFTAPAWAATGVLVIAHGTACHGGHHGGAHGELGDCSTPMPPWEKSVTDAVDNIRALHEQPIEVAFGMWETANYDAAIDRLRATLGPDTQLERLVVVPFFISSHSLVIDMQQYIFRKRDDRPFPLPVSQIQFLGQIDYLSAIDYDPTISALLERRALALAAASGLDSTADLELIIAMHGPVGERHNHLWLMNGHRYAANLAKLDFAEIHLVSLRDDAEEPVRERATETLRAAVEGAAFRGRKPLVLPLLIASGGIETGIIERLQGLDYVWTGEALVPDPLIADYLSTKIVSALR